MRHCFFLLVLLIFSSSVLADWPQFLGPERTGKIVDSNFKGKLGGDGPKELWKIDVGEGFGGAAVSKGEVFILDREDDENDIVRCFDLKTGKEKWSSKYKNAGRFSHNGSRSIPAVDDKYVFTMGCMGDVVCTNRKDGKTVWHKNLKADWKSKPEGWGFGQSPILYKDTVIFAPLSKVAGVVALDKSTGKQIWKTADIGSKDGYASPILIDLLGQKMLIQQSSDTVAGLDPDSGKSLFSYKGYQVRWAIPAPVKVSEDMLFLSGGYGAGSAMIKLKKSGSGITVEELFTIKKKGSQIHAPIFYDGYLYANFNENDNLKKKAKKQGLTCIDLKGNIKWNTGEKPNLGRGSVILINDYLFAMDGNSGELILSQANPNGYKEISRHKVLTGKGKKIWSPMAFVDGLLVVRDQGEMKCLKIY
jgi:outer membrane protein assembly factor BamB